MKFVVSALALALTAMVAVAVVQPAEAATKVAKAKTSKPLSGVIYGNQRRIGGYSYKYSDVISPGSRTNPAVTGLYESGAIDGDFFFPRPSGPFGGYTPYMH
jgi:hypothetical protein